MRGACELNGDFQLACLRTGQVPFFLQLHVNSACNLKCAHCYQEKPQVGNGGALEPQDLLSLIEQYKQFLGRIRGNGTIYFSGGEPLLDAGLPDYVRRARSLRIFPRIFSNGTLFGSKNADELARAGAGVVQISLDGMEETHDDIRGKGTFRRATRGLDHCAAAGIPTTVMFTVHKGNAGDFEPLVLHAIDHHVTRISFGRLVPVGRGTHLASGVLSSSGLRRFFRTAKRLRRKYRRKIEFAIHDPLWMRYVGIQNTAGCSVGRHGICVEFDGAIMPCRRMGVVVGNIRAMTLWDAWQSPYMLHFRKRDNFTGKCGKCDHLHRCGGCRAVARALSGNDFAPDPSCPF